MKATSEGPALSPARRRRRLVLPGWGRRTEEGSGWMTFVRDDSGDHNETSRSVPLASYCRALYIAGAQQVLIKNPRRTYVTLQRISRHSVSLESHELPYGKYHRLHFTDEKTMAQVGLEPGTSDASSTHAAF